MSLSVSFSIMSIKFWACLVGDNLFSVLGDFLVPLSYYLPQSGDPRVSKLHVLEMAFDETLGAHFLVAVVYAYLPNEVG